MLECLFCGCPRPENGFTGGERFEANIGTFYACASCCMDIGKGDRNRAQAALLTGSTMKFKGESRADIRAMANLPPIQTGAGVELFN